MNSFMKLFESRDNLSLQKESEPDSEISNLCDAINNIEGCKTISSCPQHHFADDENDSTIDQVYGGRQVYISVIVESISSLCILIDAFTKSPYKWKLIVPRRHGRDYSLESNQIKMIFQYAFDNKLGRNKEFDRLIKYIHENS